MLHFLSQIPFWLPLSNTSDIKKYDGILSDVRKNQYGLIFYIPFGTASLAIQKNISLWVDELPKNWDKDFDLGGNDLAVLVSILISRNWSGNIDLNISNSLKMNQEDATIFNEMVRFPKETNINILEGQAIDNIENFRNADLNVFSISDELSTVDMINMVQKSRISAIFCIDSGFENALV